MAKFSAESLSPIEYDFTGFNDPQGNPINDEGRVAEPSRAQVNQMMEDVQAAFKELGIDSKKTETPEGIVDTMNSLEGDDEDTFAKMSEKMLDAMAGLCNGKPSYDSLSKLPYRPFMAFFGYLMGEVMSPETSAPDTKNSRGILKSV